MIIGYEEEHAAVGRAGPLRKSPNVSSRRSRIALSTVSMLQTSQGPVQPSPRSRSQAGCPTELSQELSQSGVWNGSQTEATVAAATCQDDPAAAWLQFAPVSLTWPADWKTVPGMDWVSDGSKSGFLRLGAMYASLNTSGIFYRPVQEWPVEHFGHAMGQQRQRRPWVEWLSRNSRIEHTAVVRQCTNCSRHFLGAHLLKLYERHVRYQPIRRWRRTGCLKSETSDFVVEMTMELMAGADVTDRWNASAAEQRVDRTPQLTGVDFSASIFSLQNSSRLRNNQSRSFLADR